MIKKIFGLVINAVIVILIRYVILLVIYHENRILYCNFDYMSFWILDYLKGLSLLNP